MLQLTSVRHFAHQRHGFVSNTETQMRIASGKARYAQYAQRIFTKGGRDMAQQTFIQIVTSVVGIDDLAVIILREGR